MSRAINLAELTVLNEEVAALVAARMPLEAELRRLGSELPGRSAELAERLGDRMEGGASLTAALDAEGDDLPPVYRAVVAAGLRSGRLSAALESLVDSATRLEHIRQLTGVALVYPLWIVMIVWGLLALAAFVLFPTLDWSGGQSLVVFDELPAGLWIVLGLTAVVPTIVILVALRWWWRARSAAALSVRPGDRTSWVPAVAQARHFGLLATFAEVLSVQVEAEVPLDEALVTAAQVGGDERLREAVNQLATQICAGQPASTSELVSGKSEFPAIPPLVRLALRHADHRPLMLSALRQAATTYHDRADRAAHWTAEYVPVILTMAVGGLATMGYTVLMVWPYVTMLYRLTAPQ